MHIPVAALAGTGSQGQEPDWEGALLRLEGLVQLHQHDPAHAARTPASGCLSLAHPIADPLTPPVADSLTKGYAGLGGSQGHDQILTFGYDQSLKPSASPRQNAGASDAADAGGPRHVRVLRQQGLGGFRMVRGRGRRFAALRSPLALLDPGRHALVCADVCLPGRHLPRHVNCRAEGARRGVVAHGSTPPAAGGSTDRTGSLDVLGLGDGRRPGHVRHRGQPDRDGGPAPLALAHAGVLGLGVDGLRGAGTHSAGDGADVQSGHRAGGGTHLAQRRLCSDDVHPAGVDRSGCRESADLRGLELCARSVG